MTLFTIAGQWHAPNWTADGKYFVSDLDGSLYRIPVSGANIGKPEKIFGDPEIDPHQRSCPLMGRQADRHHGYHAAATEEYAECGGIFTTRS